uniref:GG12961 n=2 Tax=Drosophila erecta TaxID=7220 RepID=B3P2H1_DROER
MANAKISDEIKRGKKKRLEDLLERTYRQKVRIVRGLTARQASATDFELCAKWIKVFRRATKKERRAKDYLVELILRQLRQTGHLSLPFTDLANCSLDLRLLLDEEGRQHLRRFSPRQLVAPMPSSSSLARRPLKSTSFEWRRRVRHLDHLEDRYWRKEQEVCESLQHTPTKCLKPELPPSVSRPRKRVKTVGVQADVAVVSPRAERDLCERERKQCEILKRRERDRVQRQLREQERERQRTLQAEQQMLERQGLEKARQLRDRRLREQQLKVKERRDHERHLLLKKREERRLQEQRLWAQRRPSTSSSQDVKIQQRAILESKQEARHDHEHDPRYLPQATTAVPVDTGTTQSARRMQQLHLRAENIKRKVLAYEQLKKYHRERARAERERLDGNAEGNGQKQQHEKSMNVQINATERKGLKERNAEQELETDQRKEFKEKRKNILNRIRKRQEKEEFERRNCPKAENDSKENDKIDRRDQKNREEFERKRERDAKILKERQERAEFERKVWKKLETERREREEFERNRQEELRILKERQENEEFERRELEKKLDADLKQKEELERQREDKRKELRDKELERKIFEKLEADRKIREEFERQRQEELKNLRERQEKEEFERKELEKKLEAEQKQKEDIKKLREEDLKCLKSLQSREEFERQVLEKLEAERKEREAFEKKTCEEREREENKIEELKKKFKDLQERDAEWNEQRLNRELEKKEQECERITREEERLKEEMLLEKLKRSTVEREVRERKKREDDLQREQILREWLQKQEQQEDREREEREKREEIIMESITADGNKHREQEEAEKKAREELDRLPRQRQEVQKLEKENPKKVNGQKNVWTRYEEERDRRYPESPNQEEMEGDSRIQERHMVSRLGVHKGGVGHLGKEKDQKRVASERKSKSWMENGSVENSPEVTMELGLTGRDVTNVHRSCQQLEGSYENARVRLKKLHERNNRIIEEVQGKFQVLEKMRLEAGKLEARNPLSTRYPLRSLNKLQSKKDAQRPPSSSHEYFQKRSQKTRSERWARFIESEEESAAEDLPGQGRNCVVLSSSGSDTLPDPCYSLVGRYCPLTKTYTVEHQTPPPIRNQDSAQREAYGSYVLNRVADWRKTSPSFHSTDEAEPGDERGRWGGKPSGIGLTYCTRTGRKRFPRIKRSDINPDSCGLKEDRVQQRRVFGQLLSQARTFGCCPEILSAENCLLEKKLARAKNKYIQESVLRVSRYVIRVFQNDNAIESSEEENESLENRELEQIYLQETDATLLIPRPIFKTLMLTLLTSNESISPYLSEKITNLEVQLTAYLKKISSHAFARGARALRRKVKHLVDQQRQLQSRRLAEICRDSEEQTFGLWRRLARSSDSFRGIRDLFRNCCDLRDPMSCVALQNIERLYREWKDQRFAVD